MDNFIEMKDASKTIKGMQVLQDISLAIPHCICGVIGQNGAGKTMLLKLICGLIRATSGSVRVFDEVVGRSGRVAPRTGVLIEHPGFLPDYSAYENLLSLVHSPRINAEKHLIPLLRKVGLDPCDKTPAKKLSLGAKQKLGIAEAFLNTPRLVLLDEPSINLDEASRSSMHELILTRYQEGATIVIASHDRHDIDQLCNMVVRLENGRVIEVIRREVE